MSRRSVIVSANRAARNARRAGVRAEEKIFNSTFCTDLYNDQMRDLNEWMAAQNPPSEDDIKIYAERAEEILDEYEICRRNDEKNEGFFDWDTWVGSFGMR